ncbi:alpha-galactosidase D [Granulicella arctica]|uniref:alpha-galactosidase D n=1 Tax=Granulicella arctica TaxID=940613 RepID=UPI0021E0F980|nr:CBM35 domain-containing protein [Granulicella arctica]
MPIANCRFNLRLNLVRCCVLSAAVLAILPKAAQGQVNGVGQKPYLGWSTFSQQTVDGSFLTQANVQAQSDALKSSGLQEHGFTYINVDSGWQGTFDGNGRPTPNASQWDMKALVDHIHANGQKAGIYWIPGIEQPAVDGNYPVLGTALHTQDIVVTPLARGNAFGGTPPNPYHDKLDFTKPGAQEYINSVVALFASWGIDFIKLDAVTPGSYSNDLSIDNRADVAAYSKAITLTGRPMWFTISWQLDKDYLSTWQQFANARRIDDDVECEGRCSTLTNWARIALREYDSVGWEHDAGAQVGWNDLDTLDVGDGDRDGLSDVEKQTATTIWAMANSPIYLGGDLTKLDSFAKAAFTNDELIAVDQSGHPGVQVTGGAQPVWIADAGRGSYYVALYNLNGMPGAVTVRWSDLGFGGAARVRDVWNRIDLGASTASFTTTLLGHGSRLLKVTPFDKAVVAAGQSYEAEAAMLTGNATISTCAACSGGSKVSYLGASPSTNDVVFNNVFAESAGTYRMEVDAAAQGPRALVYAVNGSSPATLNLSGGSFNLPQVTSVPVVLRKGLNTITFGNPGTYGADLDRIVIGGDGKELAPQFTTYEAEAAQLTGTASVGGCSFCSGGAYVGNFGAGTQNSVVFPHVHVAQAGTYQLEVDYTTSGPRSLYVGLNGGPLTELDLDGSTFDSPVPVVLPVVLAAGDNTVTITNPNPQGYAPGLDSITVGPVVNASDLHGVVTHQAKLGGLSLWQLTLTNDGVGPASKAEVNTFTVVPTGGDAQCKASVLMLTPSVLGLIAPGGKRSLEIPILFSSGCRADTSFAVHAVFSANNGADVGMVASSGEKR